jgi:putative spermidine/putrescine transport system substrate-binding protein
LAYEVTGTAQLADNFQALQRWQYPDRFSSWWPFKRRNPIIPDLVSLGDAWLGAAVAQDLLVPLDPDAWPQWQQLPGPWRSIVQRNSQGLVDTQGSVWAAPYRWGTTVIAYRHQPFRALGWEPTDWGDLWKPELQGKISLPDQPREVLGLTLKHLGYSYNTKDLNQVPDLAPTLEQLHRQVKLYSSDYYLQPLFLEDTWLAVGWSTDLLPLLPYDRDLRLVVPKSGTALWADLWVRPQNAEANHRTWTDDWINFFWQPDVALKLTQLSNATSPLPLEPPGNGQSGQILQAKAPTEILFPNPSTITQSEFIQPLDPATTQTYWQFWQQMRQEPNPKVS